MQSLLSNPTNIEHVRSLTTADVIYVSLNFDNPELHKVLPWAGTNRGPQSIVDVFNGIGRVWETKAFVNRPMMGKIGLIERPIMMICESDKFLELQYDEQYELRKQSPL